MTEITPRPQDANHARLMQIVSDLEQELQKVPATPELAQKLSDDFARLKSHLNETPPASAPAEEHQNKIRSSTRELIDSLEGAVLKDSPYVAELGRILGMI